MTISYTSEVATVRFRTLWILLLRWKGSIYKVLWKDFIVFASLYYVVSILYRLVLTDSQRRFEKLAIYCDQHAGDIPLGFVLGFYVTLVVNRWWAQVNEYVPGTANLAIMVSTYLHGSDERGRLMRRTIIRYVTLGWILAMRSISAMAKKRFPTLDHVVELGAMTSNERDIYENVKTASNKYFLPYVWAASLLKRARKEERITSDHAFIALVQEVCKFRGSLATLFNYDWISIPLMYTQVVTIAVRVYFLACLLGRQFLDPDQNYPNYKLDIYVPVFTFLQFLFYNGWLKVAESLINPFGEDDDDYETNCVLDRIIQVGYLIVDELHSELPTLVRDQYWDEVEFVLPYTAASKQYRSAPYQGSANVVEVPASAQQLVLPAIQEEDESAGVSEVPARPAPDKTPSWDAPVRVPATANSKGLVSMLSRRSRGQTDSAKPAERLVSIAQLREQRERDGASAKAVRFEKRWSDPILAPANKDSLISITRKNMEMKGHTLEAFANTGQVSASMRTENGEFVDETSLGQLSMMPGAPIHVLVSSPDEASGRNFNRVPTSVTIFPTWSASRGQASVTTAVELPQPPGRRFSQATEIEAEVPVGGRPSAATTYDTPAQLRKRSNSNSALNRQDGHDAENVTPAACWHDADI